jgi:hypothetical protein
VKDAKAIGEYPIHTEGCVTHSLNDVALSIGDGVDGAEVVVVEVAGFVRDWCCWRICCICCTRCVGFDGRFLSADPYIQSPYNTQSYNRYSYVMNNPLKYTDPSGYNPFKAIAGCPPIAFASFTEGCVTHSLNDVALSIGNGVY